MNTNRKGAALLMAIVVMAVLTIILSVMTVQIVLLRNMGHHRQRQLQAEWLARAGVEFAAGRLLESPKEFSADKEELLPDSKLRIAAKVAEPDLYLVTCEAEVGLTDGRAVIRTATTRFRRSEKGGVVQLEAVVAAP